MSNNLPTVIYQDIFQTTEGSFREGWWGGGGGLIENDSLKFQFTGGLKTRDRCERMQTIVPFVPLWLLEGHRRIEEESGHWVNEVWEKWGGGGRIKDQGAQGGGGLWLQ